MRRLSKYLFSNSGKQEAFIIKIPNETNHSLYSRIWKRFNLADVTALKILEPRGDNYISTSKYSMLTFIPYSLFNQFKSISNIYFLSIIVLAYVGEFTSLYNTPFTGAGTLLALAVVLIFNMTFEAFYDIKRHFSDFKLNHKLVKRLNRTTGEVDVVPSMSLSPGEVVIIEDKHQVPADVLLIRTQNISKLICYVETSNIDGETNLKIKHCVQPLKERAVDEDALVNLSMKLICEAPNSSLSYSGFCMMEDQSKIPLDFSNLLLRGSVLRNTELIYGIVVYPGMNSKIMLSTTKTPTKTSRILRICNKIVLFVLLLDFSASLFSAFMSMIFSQHEAWHGLDINEFKTNSSQLFSMFLTFIILYSGAVPISLLVILAFTNFVHALQIQWDPLMSSTKKVGDQQMKKSSKCNNMDLVQEIGQVQYVFTDKTGTLTRNEMKVVGFCIGQDCKVYGIGEPDREDQLSSEAAFSKIFDTLIVDRQSNSTSSSIDLFLECVSVCHTVLVDRREDGVTYNAEGPDEEALVNCAHNLGYKLEKTDDNCYVLRILQNDHSVTKKYDVVAVNAFNSTRKRMSILLRETFNVEVTDCDTVREKEVSKYTLFVKGADSIMFELANNDPMYLQSLEEQLVRFSVDGLRTLVFGKKSMSCSEAERWLKSYIEARSIIGTSKAQHLADVAKNIENNLTILGASAIEDRLQDKVPQTLTSLREAGIKLWMITGDKSETAVNIAFSSGLMLPTGHIIRVNSKKLETNISTLQDIKGLIKKENMAFESKIRKSGRDIIRAGKQFLLRASQLTSNTLDSVHSFFVNSIQSDAGSRKDSFWITSSPANQYARLSTKFNFSHSSEILETDDPEPDYSKVESMFTELNVEAENLNLLLTGDALQGLLEDEDGNRGTQELLLQVATLCSAVIACRVSPKQKALLVRMIRHWWYIFFLYFIIDGANDVPAILEANVGVGIAGHEGQQAALSADYEVPNFQCLRRLLLTHGRYNYIRASTLTLFVFYSQLLLVVTFFVYNFQNQFSGGTVFFVFLLTFYNYPTNISISVISCYNVDISEETILKFPDLYSAGRMNLHLHPRRIIAYVMRAVVHGMIICMVHFGYFADKTASRALVSSSVYLTAVFVVNIRCCFEIYTWSCTSFLVIFVCFGLFLLFEPLYYQLDPMISLVYGGSSLWLGRTGEAAYSWSTTLFAVLTCFIFDLITTYIRKEFFFALEDIVIELDRGYGPVSSRKSVQLSKIMKKIKVLTQPLKLPQGLVTELVSSIQNIHIRPVSKEKNFAFDEPKDEQSEQTSITSEAKHRSIVQLAKLWNRT
eukprot:maker-scaffold_2-snap-gene-15.43-mRNA-1 protein AED:0.03 eAED:0.06 QI:0/0/0/1/0/0/2/0/1308